jgi:hypothetical protein
MSDPSERFRKAMEFVMSMEGGRPASQPELVPAAGPLLCSECFRDQGLRLDAARLGFRDENPCPKCGALHGRKLDKERLTALAHRFFVRGTIWRGQFGGAPRVQFNTQQYPETDIGAPEWLRNDVALIGQALKIGFFPYGPRLWMIGEVEPLKALQRADSRPQTIERILGEYPCRMLAVDEVFYRIRHEPARPSEPKEYDSPPDGVVGKGRLDSVDLPVMYGSQDLEVCIHECRVTADDLIYAATLRPVRLLRLLDLTAVLAEQTTEFESLDMAVHMLFLAGSHSYDMSRAIAAAAHEAGFDGVVYPSYFSLVRTGAMPFETAYGISVRKFASLRDYAQSHVIPNMALFGRPIEIGSVRVECINRVVLQQVSYDVVFGPV